jgi:hypothetical protein
MQDTKIDWRCLNCGKKYERQEIVKEMKPLFNMDGKLCKVEPVCDKCDYVAYITNEYGEWKDLNEGRKKLWE